MRLEKISGEPHEQNHDAAPKHPRAPMLLARLAVAPLMLDRVRLVEASRTGRIAMMFEQVLDLARRGADAQAEMIDATPAA